MAIRFNGRILQGAELRQFNRDISRSGLRREFRKAISRGDSTASINKILEQGGYVLNRFQLGSYIGTRYSPSVSTSYFDKLSARFGNRSTINIMALSRAGYEGKIRFTLRFKDAKGKTRYRTVNADGSEYNSITELLDKLEEDWREDGISEFEYNDFSHVVSYTFY